MSDDMTCFIILKEELDQKWQDYFAPFECKRTNGMTLLTGKVHDQAELFGVLIKIRDAGLSLISVDTVQ
jgi:hypothetical protein